MRLSILDLQEEKFRADIVIQYNHALVRNLVLFSPSLNLVTLNQ